MFSMLKTFNLVFGRKPENTDAHDIRKQLDAAVKENSRVVAELSRVMHEGPPLKLIAVPRRDDGKFAARMN